MQGSQQTNYAEKFERLLDLFPHPDRRDLPAPKKRRWQMVEISEQTGGEVSPTYLSVLRSGGNRKPGMNHLDLIAKAMGFPFELWLTEPEQWDSILADREPLGMQLAATESYQQSMSEFLEQLFPIIINRRTGRPYTNCEVAQASDGWLTEEEVEALRNGTSAEPSRGKLLALSKVFGVEVSYWYGASDPAEYVDEDLQYVLQASDTQRRLLKTAYRLTDNQVDALLGLMDAWDASKQESWRSGYHEGQLRG